MARRNAQKGFLDTEMYAQILLEAAFRKNEEALFCMPLPICQSPDSERVSCAGRRTKNK